MLIKNTVSIASKIIAVSVIGLSSLMTSNTVSAESRSMAGSGCLPYNDNHTNLWRMGDGRLENRNTTGYRLVDCQLSVEKGSSPTITGKIRVVDASGQEDFKCYLRTRSFHGKFLMASNRSTSGINTAPQTLSFGNIDFEQEGYSYVRCSIPGVDMGRVSSIVSVNVRN